MTASVGTLVAGFAAYASSNLDNVLVLIALLNAPGLNRRAVIGGHLAGILIVALAVGGLALAPDLISPDRVGLLGIVPLSLGAARLFQLARGGEMEIADVSAGNGRSGFMQALTLHVTGSADTLAVFGPLVVDSLPSAKPALAATFLFAAILLAGIALLLSRREAALAILSRGGAWTAPVIMVLVGAYVLADTADDLLI